MAKWFFSFYEYIICIKAIQSFKPFSHSIIPTMTSKKKKKKFSRRKFLKRGGIVLGGTAAVIYFARTPIRRSFAHLASTIDLPSGIFNFEPDFWFEVMEDNSILMKSPKVEMGQGIFTGFAMLAAEELEVPVEKIKVVPGTTSNSANDMAGTGGSSSTLGLYVPIREVAATMREMLKMAAAKIWAVPLGSVVAKDGQLSTTGQSMSYIEVVQQTTDWEIPDTPALKPKSGF